MNRTNRISLHDSVVLLTGAGKGLGRAILLELQSRGAHVAAIDVDAAALRDLQPQLTGASAVFQADATDAEAMRQAVERVLQQYGRLDVVIANAGIVHIGATWETDAEAFEQVISVNLLGVYRTVRPALEPIIAARGHIIAISSVAGLLPMPMAAAYSTSKAGVDMLMRCLRFELMGSGVTCGTAYLGFVHTGMTKHVFSLQQVNRILARMPTWWLGIKPVQNPEYVARVIVNGIERRQARVFVPFMVGLTYLLRGKYPFLDDFFSKYVVGMGKRLRDRTSDRTGP